MEFFLYSEFEDEKENERVRKIKRETGEEGRKRMNAKTENIASKTRESERERESERMEGEKENE